MRRAATLLVASLLGCSGPPALLVRGGPLHTMDAAGTQASAMIVQGETIAYVGDEAGARAWLRARRARVDVLELEGRALLPGLQDTHVHLLAGGVEQGEVMLAELASVEALLDAVARWAAAHPEAAWVRGSGWSMAAFEGRLHRVQLDAIVPDRPVVLHAVDGHSVFVNSLALARAGIDARTQAPVGGVIERDASGEPTGVLHETAMQAVVELLPDPSEAEVDAGLARAQALAHAQGITSIVDAAASAWIVAGYARGRERDSLRLHVHAAVPIEPDHDAAVAEVVALRERFAGGPLQVDAIKLFVDGIVESQTAALLEPYVDGTQVAPLWSRDELHARVREADDAGLQLHAHVIGDAATRVMLDAIAELPPDHERRPLLAHLELIDTADIPRFAALGVHAAIQPLWAYPDAYVTDLTIPRIGSERGERLYPFGELVRAGATLVGGSDWTVSSMHVFAAIEVALTRRDPKLDAAAELAPLGVDQQLDRMTALRAYTSHAARASHAEHERGSLELGKRADFVVLSHDPLVIDAFALSEVSVEQTWFGGALVFER